MLERYTRVERLRFEASRQENCGIARIGEGAALNVPDGDAGIRAKRVGIIDWKEAVCVRFRYLRIRFDSQGVVCVHNVGLGSSWTFSVIFLNDSRGSTLFISSYISFT